MTRLGGDPSPRWGSTVLQPARIGSPSARSLYLVTDSLGSVRGTVIGSGALTGTGYDAWGNPQTVGGLTATTPFGFAGGYTDPTGLIYLLNRYYDPATGQFTSVDPDLAQTLQPYAYVNDNPVSLSDLTGLAWWDHGTFQGGLCWGFCSTDWFDASATFAVQIE
jgi:RHS repeat-associated protein